MKEYKPALIMIAVLSLSACDTEESSINNNITDDAVVTETVLDDVDSSEGTISDAMINVEGLDESSDTPEIVENSDKSEDGNVEKDSE